MTTLDGRPAALLISHDVVGASMAGPGIRYYHLARVLSQHVETTLAVPDGVADTLAGVDFEVVRYRDGDWNTLRPHVEDAQTCIFPGDIAASFPELAESDACLVIDGYDPLLAEWLAIPAALDEQGHLAAWQDRMVRLNRQYAIGDFFLCASERQRDWWLGLLEANGRINPATHGADPSLRKLVDVVAYGLPQETPVHSRQVVKGIWDGIAADDKLLVWGGGLWPWLDAATAIRAMAIVRERRQGVRLIFPGTRHPNPIMHGMPTRLPETKQLAGELGLTGEYVFFGDWIPYQDWASLLLECDIALTLHHDTLETRLAFRSRVLEYIWCGLPIIATRGDATSEIVEQYGLGTVVDYEDANAVADAICRLLEESATDRSSAFAVARQALTWENLARPLVEYCLHPLPAADKIRPDARASGVYLSNPWEQLRHERTYWKGLVEAYESGRFMRTMKWINRQTGRIRPVPPPDPEP